ncbi:lipocalin family protein [Schlegelella sp. S2-27]|uniref:Lipocalin family protein n=1 Tax=Caldimonas mangrovi TaxID=2944811 RepID=A0ABT0YMU4_9BURK|nr:lipocalin family protein [Caldimonas mangrovi]MCM5679471.1 lipocalin family protein [Caldimonas mangrovi]
MLNSMLTQIEQRIREAEARVQRQDARTLASCRQLRVAGGQRLRTVLIGGATTLVSGLLLRRLGRKRRRAAAHGGGRSYGWLRPLLTPALLPLAASLVTPLIGRKGSSFLARLGLPFPHTEPAGLAVAPVDLARYAGLWYEVARLPTRHESQCASDVHALYERLPEGGLRVVNRCVRGDGEVQEVEGLARIADEMSPGRLEVCFAPKWLHWWPGAWADYWVLEVDNDYTTALVGTPDRDELWVLSRVQGIDEDVYAALVDRARREGYPVEKLMRTAHTTGEAALARPVASVATASRGEDASATYH